MLKIFTRLIILILFISALAIIILYARGYRFNIKEKTLLPNGILAISSKPKAAKIYINGELKGVTDMNITLPPDSYNIEIKKDGFSTWSKKINLKGEIVIGLDPILFPTNPSLSPLTTLGIIKTMLIEQTNKVLIFSQTNNLDKDGIYIFDPDRRPLSLMQSVRPILLMKNVPIKDLDLKTANVSFSPDLSEAILDLNTASYLIDLDQENKQLFDTTNSKDALLAAWVEEKNKRTKKILETFPDEVNKIASDSFKIISFSPDETKVLYQANRNLNIPLVIKPPLIGAVQTQEIRDIKKNLTYIYDKKEDKNFQINLNPNSSETPVVWYPDSNHLVIYEVLYDKKTDKDTRQISILNYDSQNKQTIYSGPFEDAFFATTNEGNLIILANLNPENNVYPDLYQVGVR